MTIRTQTRYPATVVSDDAVGTVAWADPENAEEEDNVPATATGPGITEWLLGSGYVFNLLGTADPLAATILARLRTLAQGYHEIERIGGSVVGGFGSQNLSPNRPAGVQNGDVLTFLIMSYSGANTSFGAADGWTQAFNNTSVVDSEGGWVMGRRLLYKVITDIDNEPASYTFTHGNANTRFGFMNAFRNVDTAAPVDVAGGLAATAPDSGTGHNLNSVTTTVPNALLIGAAVLNIAPANITDSTGMDLVQSQNGAFNYNARLWTQTQAAAGATGAKTLSTTSAGTSVRTTFALRPARTSAVDDAVRIVVDGVVGEEDHASETPWETTYATREIGPFDISTLTPAEVNTDLGAAISADLSDAVEAGVDVVEMEVSYDIAVDVTLTDPTDEGTLTAPNATITWDAEVGGSAITQNNFRVRIYSLPELTLVYDSGIKVSATQEHEIGDNPTLAWSSPQNESEYRIRVDVTEDGSADPDGEGDPITGFAEVDITTAWAPPDAVTGFTVTPVTEV